MEIYAEDELSINISIVFCGFTCLLVKFVDARFCKGRISRLSLHGFVLGSDVLRQATGEHDSDDLKSVVFMLNYRNHYE